MKRLIQTLVGLLASAMLLGAAVAVMLSATTAGTVWLIEHAVSLSGVPVKLSGISGTVLRGVRVERLEGEFGDSGVDVHALEASVAWGASIVRDALVFDSLSAELVLLTSHRPGSAERQPITVVLPALPIAVAVRSLHLARLELQNTAPQYLPDIRAAIDFDGVRYRFQEIVVSADAYEFAGEITAQLQPDIPVSGSVQMRWHDPELSARVDLANTLAHLQLDVEISTPVVAGVHGHVDVLGKPDPIFDLEVSVSEWHDDRIAVTDGELALRGTLQEFDVRSSASVVLVDAQPLAVRAAMHGSMDALDVTQATIESTSGNATLAGRLVRVPQPHADLDISFADFDPAVLRAQLVGTLSGRLTLQWQPDHLEAVIEDITGTLNAAPFAARSSVHMDGEIWSTPGLELRAGENRAQVVLSLDGRELVGHAALEMPALGVLVPTLSGDLSGTLELSGTLDQPDVVARLRSSSLGYREWSAAGARLDANLRAGKNGTAELVVTKLAAFGYALDDVRFDGRGDLARFAAQASWSLADRRGHVGFAAHDEPGGWQVDIEQDAALALPAETWLLDRAVHGVIGQGNLALSAHCWRRPEGAGQICLDTLAREADEIHLIGSLQLLPVAILNRYVAALPELAGTLSGRWNLTWLAQGWQGRVSLDSDGLGVVDRGDVEVHVIELPHASASIELHDSRSTLVLRAVSDGISVLEVHATSPGFAADAPLEGTIVVQIAELGTLATLSRRVDTFQGALSGRLDLAGTLGAPVVTGQMSVHDGRLVLVDPHLELADIDVAIEISDIASLAFRGSATTIAGGRLDVTGTFVDPFEATRHLRAELVAVKVPLHVTDADAQIDAQLVLEWHAAVVALKGRVEIPRALIKLTELPEGAVAVSDDVIVVDRVEQRGAATRLSVDLVLVLRDDVRFSAFGLETKLDGQLRLRQSTAGVVQLNGTLAVVDGTFTAYGQKLSIESGRLVYSGPPDNPFVDARATRTIAEVGSTIVVGAHVQGPARSIETTLFSNPQMSEAQALSYLVLGRPLAAADSEQGSDMTGAAIALGLKGAAPVIDEIRNITGIDELTATGGTTEELAVVAAKRINERLFVRYSYQTFTRTSAVLIELLLSRRVSLEATAAQVPAIDVMYHVGEYN